jgi:hypothetical protein
VFVLIASINREIGRWWYVAELSLAQVDIETVLLRLTRYAQALFGAWRVTGLEHVDVAFAGGEGPEDLAMNLIVRFLDPNDETVRWSRELGPPTTDGLYALLKKALWHDFLDLKKSKRYQTSVYADEEGTTDQPDGVLNFDQMLAHFETPEGALLKKQRVDAITGEFKDDAKAQEIVRLQLDPDGYAAFTNQELAELLDITVADVENRKKRVKNRLLRILRRSGESASA